MTVLVVVDMQPGFKQAAELCLQSTLALVEKAKRLQSTIVLVELNRKYHSTTLEPIVELVKNYCKLIVVEKTMDDGSTEIKKALKNDVIGLTAKTDTFRVCGVYANCCVKETAIGLANKYSTSKVIIHHEACCGTSLQIQSKWKNHYDWSWIIRHNAPKNLFLSRNNRIVKKAS